VLVLVEVVVAPSAAVLVVTVTLVVVTGWFVVLIVPVLPTLAQALHAARAARRLIRHPHSSRITLTRSVLHMLCNPARSVAQTPIWSRVNAQ